MPPRPRWTFQLSRWAYTINIFVINNWDICPRLNVKYLQDCSVHMQDYENNVPHWEGNCWFSELCCVSGSSWSWSWSEKIIVHHIICDIIAGPGECQRQVLCPREGRHQEQEGGRHLRGQEGGLQAFWAEEEGSERGWQAGKLILSYCKDKTFIRFKTANFFGLSYFWRYIWLVCSMVHAFVL